MINDNIVITILAIEGDKVKIGIEAPRDVSVFRKELWQAINEQQTAGHLDSGQGLDQFDEQRKLLSDEIGQEDQDI